jgi:hypothetical protein
VKRRPARRYASPAVQNFGYDAVANTRRRRLAAPMLRSEDWELQASNRRQLVASQRDLGRNFAVTRWLLERHLDSSLACIQVPLAE